MTILFNKGLGNCSLSFWKRELKIKVKNTFQKKLLFSWHKSLCLIYYTGLLILNHILNEVNARIKCQMLLCVLKYILKTVLNATKFYAGLLYYVENKQYINQMLLRNVFNIQQGSNF